MGNKEGWLKGPRMTELEMAVKAQADAHWESASREMQFYEMAQAERKKMERSDEIAASEYGHNFTNSEAGATLPPHYASPACAAFGAGTNHAISAASEPDWQAMMRDWWDVSKQTIPEMLHDAYIRGYETAVTQLTRYRANEVDRVKRLLADYPDERPEPKE